MKHPPMPNKSQVHISYAQYNKMYRAYLSLHCVVIVLYRNTNKRKRNSSESMKKGEKIKPNNREVNNIVLKANTSISALLLFQC